LKKVMMQGIDCRNRWNTAQLASKKFSSTDLIIHTIEVRCACVFLFAACCENHLVIFVQGEHGHAQQNLP
jgi:hypothetical protein